MNARRYAIALVGCGPKGTFCLERLARELTRRDAPVELHVYEPHPTPGAGPVFDPELAPFLLMNQPARDVDIWSRDAGGTLAGAPTHDLPSWLSRHRPDLADPDVYVPRAVAGRYLAQAACRILGALRDRIPVRLHCSRVSGVEPSGTGWSIRSPGGPARTVDEVVLATGHQSRRPAGGCGSVPAYPIAGLDEECVPPGSAVAVRGLGLTALDVLRCLERREPPARPRRMRFFSRTGRPMIPKLDGACCRRADGLEPLWSRGEERARNSGSLDQVVAILGQTADAALDEFGSRPGAPRMARRLLEDLTAHRGGAPEEAGAEEILARGLATAHDEAPWDARRALGESWRRIYPGLVDWVERLGPRDWERATFHRLCREMERLAFGPPAEVARQLLDGIRSGRVEVSAEAAGVAEVRVNAVLPGPGIAPEAAPPWSSLLACGAARTFRGTGGVQIRVDGQIMGRRGRPTRGLYAVGRPTEGSVLGNDTLSRCLHRHPARWAAGVLERARSSRSRSGLGTSTRSFSS